MRLDQEEAETMDVQKTNREEANDRSTPSSSRRDLMKDQSVPHITDPVAQVPAHITESLSDQFVIPPE